MDRSGGLTLADVASALRIVAGLARGDDPGVDLPSGDLHPPSAPDGRLTLADAVLLLRFVQTPAAWSFEMPGDAGGWRAEHQLTTPVVAGGALTTRSTGLDPYLVQPGPLALDASDGLTVEVRMEVSRPSVGQLFWTTAGRSLNEPMSARFSVNAGGMQAYRLRIPPQATLITQLRLDPLEATGEIVIESIIVHRSGEPLVPPVGLGAVPKSPPPAQRLALIHLDGQPPAVQFLVHTLQGLVNRTQPRLYAYDRRYEGGQDASLLQQTRDWWYEDLIRRGFSFDTVPDYRNLLTLFPDAFRGALLYEASAWTDARRANTINAVTTLCGLEDLLPVTEEMNETLKLPVMRDVRGVWPTDSAFREWLDTDLSVREQASHRALVHRHPWSHYLTDYAVANRLVTFWMGRSAWQNTEPRWRYQRVLNQIAPNRPVLGAWQSWWPTSPEGSELSGLEELTYVKFLSDHGRHGVVVASNGNFTVHSGFPAPPLRQAPIAFRPLERDKVYVTFVLSDGDNVSGFMLIRPLIWRDPARGSVPIGWSFSPALLDLAPNALDWFYRSATSNDYFVTGTAGLGYVQAAFGSLAPDGPRHWDDYLDLTARYMREADSREAWIWWMDAAAIQRFADRVPNLNALFLEAEPRLDAYPNSFHQFSGLHAFHNFGSAGAALAPDSEAQRWRDTLVARVGSRRPGFLFLGFNGFQTSPTQISNFMRRLPADYVAVRPDEFVHLYKESLKP